MFGLGNNSRQNQERRENAQITRAQLRVQAGRWRASMRHWYRRLTGRKPGDA